MLHDRLRRLEILLVEDDLGDVDLMKEILSESRHRMNVSVACDGEKAMKFLKKSDSYVDAPRPDLVLLDLNMPRKDGRQVLEEIKSDPDLRCIPVVILTTSDDERDVKEAYCKGANCYLQKPLGLKQFSKLINVVENFWFDVVKLPPRD